MFLCLQLLNEVILVFCTMTINTDPFSNTAFSICTELEIHIPLLLHLWIPQTAMEHCTSDLLFFLVCDLWTQKVPTCDSHIPQASDLLNPKPARQSSCFSQFLRNLLWTGKIKEMPLGYSSHATVEKASRETSSWHPFWNTQTKWKSQMS